MCDPAGGSKLSLVQTAPGGQGDVKTDSKTAVRPVQLAVVKHVGTFGFILVGLMLIK